MEGEIDAGREAAVRASFAAQGLMGLIGATVERVEPGVVSIVLPVRGDLTQQHGYVHGAIVAALADTACGYAALSLVDEGSDVLTVEYKVNFVAPALGDRLVAVGRVTAPGRSLSACVGEVHAERDGERKLVAQMLATMKAVSSRGRALQ